MNRRHQWVGTPNFYSMPSTAGHNCCLSRTLPYHLTNCMIPTVEVGDYTVLTAAVISKCNFSSGVIFGNAGLKLLFVAPGRLAQAELQL